MTGRALSTYGACHANDYQIVAQNLMECNPMTTADEGRALTVAELLSESVTPERDGEPVETITPPQLTRREKKRFAAYWPKEDTG